MASETLHKDTTLNRPRADRIDSSRRKIDWKIWPEMDSFHAEASTKIISNSQIDRPDIEDEEMIAWGLAQSEVISGAPATVDILYGAWPNLGMILQPLGEYPKSNLTKIMQIGEKTLQILSLMRS